MADDVHDVHDVDARHCLRLVSTLHSLLMVDRRVLCVVVRCVF